MASIVCIAKFEKVVSDRALLKPDLGYQDVISRLTCAILCNIHVRDCSTISVLPDDTQLLCQMSKRRASSMEKKEAFVNPGSRIYQKKVNLL
jgi:hypothetical protein